MDLTAEIASRILSIGVIAFVIYIFYILTRKNMEKYVMKKDEYFVCPKCGSTSLRFSEKGNSWKREMRLADPLTSFECLDCRYIGIAPKVKREELDHFRRKLKENT